MSHAKDATMGAGIASYMLASLFLLYEMALQVSPSIMTNQLMYDFHIGAALLGAMIGIYFYSYAPMQVPAGFFYDRFGPRLLVTCATIICAVGLLFLGLPTILLQLLLAVFAWGLARRLLLSVR